MCFASHNLRAGDITIAEVKTLDANGISKSSFDISRNSKMGFSIKVDKTAAAGTVQFYYYANDPDGKPVTGMPIELHHLYFPPKKY